MLKERLTGTVVFPIRTSPTGVIDPRGCEKEMLPCAFNVTANAPSIVLLKVAEEPQATVVGAIKVTGPETEIEPWSVVIWPPKWIGPVPFWMRLLSIVRLPAEAVTSPELVKIADPPPIATIFPF